jgi:hypothetical protein
LRSGGTIEAGFTNWAGRAGRAGRAPWSGVAGVADWALQLVRRGPWHRSDQ